MRDGGAEAAQQEHTGEEAWHSLIQLLNESLTHSLSKENVGTRAEACQFTFKTLQYSGRKGRRALGLIQDQFVFLFFPEELFEELLLPLWN